MLKNRSIRFKLTLWFSLALVLIVAVTYVVVLESSRAVLRSTVRDYLISTVEENTDKIVYSSSRDGTSAAQTIPYDGGYLIVDEDFMGVVNDVHTALYTADGTMLYGENPLSRQTEAIAFSESALWSMDVAGTRYDLYDRKLAISLPSNDVLWIRGIVPETRSSEQLDRITRLSLVVLPVLLIVAIAVSYFLAGRLLRPLRKVESAAASISQGQDLSVRIEESANNDEVGRLAKAFNRMLDRLEGAFEKERQFTSDVSHELRTPTSVILAQTDYTLGKERSADEYVEALQTVHKQGERMNTLINDMLTFTRMNQAANRTPFERVDLSLIVGETAAQIELAHAADAKGITLTTKLDENAFVNGNRDLLARLAQNLIENAYRYGRDGGHVTVSVNRVVAMDDAPSFVVLTVQDDGIGIAPDGQDKIFDRFYKSDASRTDEGTGLGLSIVKSIADMHEASVSVESALGEGSTFTVMFPLAPW